ncbi:NO-inducible flavohemoprotein [Ideonella paludis]|uniref:nitric oxide dioxygenase n=1 Tax=Ideonella paludis TaxID=1233411 RepID=A0ABS5DT58_9BURK|nr:NO-inducible flavohemoprotein [Ideonella paludis]
MLDDTTRALVKATVPTLATHGEALTRHFYQRLFSHHPMLKEVFNQGHQHTGSQQQALAAAVLAYAQHIDDPSALHPALLHIAHKHVSLGIRPEHYPLVGQQLLAAMSDVMGDAATPELLAAWGAAYAQLAEVLIDLERTLYAQAAQQAGGWSGARSMRVRRKTPHGEAICSFELVPADGGPLPHYRPGQYVSVSQWVPSWGLQQWRQYSLVGAAGGDCLEIGVKRERPQGGCPMGQVSTALHERVQEGDVLAVSAPAGDFVLHEDRSTPLLLLSGGVGITPMMSMLAHLAATRSPRELHFWHACQSPRHQAFAAEVQAHLAHLPNAHWRVAFEADAPAEPWAQAGRLNVGDLPPGLLARADVYLCGPLGFMAAQREALLAAGLPSEQLHQESFGVG